jgi:thymidylate kinase
MITVALAGADGAGKSTMSRRLEKSLPVPAKYIYMGINREASNFALPTTLLWKRIQRASGRQIDMGGPPDPNRLQQLPKHPLKRIVRELKSGLRITNLIAEEWFRQLVAWYYQFRGYVVIFDRHFYFDYYKHHIADSGIKRTIADRVHGFMLNHVFPKPDFVIFLDAPPEVLFSRKGEGTLELLEQRRQEYLQIQEKVERFITVDATQPMDEVAQQICNLVMDFYSSKRGTAKGLYKSQAK